MVTMPMMVMMMKIITIIIIIIIIIINRWCVRDFRLPPRSK